MEVFLLLGSNLNRKLDQIEQAKIQIIESIGPIWRSSSLYETTPWGVKEQPAFLNQVVVAETSMSALDIWSAIELIESNLGRKSRPKWHSREIDIDILFYGKEKILNDILEIPHPRIAERLFTLIPLMEIAPTFEHPTLKKSIEELYMECRDLEEVILLEEE